MFRYRGPIQLYGTVTCDLEILKSNAILHEILKWNAPLGNIFTTYHSSTTQYVNDLDLSDLSMLLNVKSNGTIERPIFGLRLMFNSNIWPNLSLLRDIRLRNFSDLTFDLSMSLKVNLSVPLDSPYRVSYQCLIVT